MIFSGPLVGYYDGVVTVVGITSFTGTKKTCEDGEVPTFFVNVLESLNWILSIAAIDEHCYEDYRKSSVIGKYHVDDCICSMCQKSLSFLQ